MNVQTQAKLSMGDGQLSNARDSSANDIRMRSVVEKSLEDDKVSRRSYAAGQGAKTPRGLATSATWLAFAACVAWALRTRDTRPLALWCVLCTAHAVSAGTSSKARACQPLPPQSIIVTTSGSVASDT